MSLKSKRYKEFVTKNPRLTEMFDCLDKTKVASKTRECVKQSNL